LLKLFETADEEILDRLTFPRREWHLIFPLK
jgi:hypothetical protein